MSVRFTFHYRENMQFLSEKHNKLKKTKKACELQRSGQVEGKNFEAERC